MSSVVAEAILHSAVRIIILFTLSKQCVLTTVMSRIISWFGIDKMHRKDNDFWGILFQARTLSTVLF